MAKFERIINLPAVFINRKAAEEIVELTHSLAERHITAELAARLRAVCAQSYNPVSIFAQAATAGTPQTEDEFVALHVQNEAYRDLLRPTYGDRYTFLSPNGNVQFLYKDFTYDDMPPDTDVILIETGGPLAELLALSAKARPQFLELKDPNWNRILVQGPEAAWVNDTYTRLKTIIESSKEPFRHLAYHYMPLFIWATFFAIVILEYKLFRLFSGFDWSIPLNGLQLLFAFVVLALTLLASSHLFQRILHFLYPYFELDGNLARRRLVWRTPVITGVGALYTAAVGMLFAM